MIAQKSFQTIIPVFLVLNLSNTYLLFKKKEKRKKGSIPLVNTFDHYLKSVPNEVKI